MKTRSSKRTITILPSTAVQKLYLDDCDYVRYRNNFFEEVTPVLAAAPSVADQEVSCKS